MRDILKNAPNKKKIKISIAKKNGIYFGWGLNSNWWDIPRSRIIMIYVRPKFRRKGIGTLLAKAVKTRTSKASYWNTSSKKFFQAVNIKNTTYKYKE